MSIVWLDEKMDMETITLIISVVALVFSIVSTLISLFYLRRRTKIMDEEAKKKRNFREASEKIRQAINIIKGNTDFKDYSSPTLHSSRDDILSYIHDNKLEKLELNIKPKQFVYLSKMSRNIIKDMEGLKKAVKEFADKDYVGWIGFQFDCMHATEEVG